MSTATVRTLAARVGAISRHDPHDPALYLLRHKLAVERIAAAIGDVNPRALTESERARLRRLLDGWPESGSRVFAGCDPDCDGHNPRSPARMHAEAGRRNL